jgi:hypothetical protein
MANRRTWWRSRHRERGQLEFYLPLRIDGDLRQFDFIWPGGLSTDSFEFEVQQPVGATAMEVSPSPTSQTTDSAGLTYHRLDLGPQTAEARPAVGFRYRKDTAALSAETTGAAGPLATPAPARAASVDVQGALPWLVLLAGLALIAGGVIYYVRTRADERSSRPRHRPASQPQEKPDEVDASPVFCHNCGTQAAPAIGSVGAVGRTRTWEGAISVPRQSLVGSYQSQSRAPLVIPRSAGFTSGHAGYFNW